MDTAWLSHSPQFPTTQWHTVAQAGQSPTEESRQALSELYARYWYPLYANIRISGYPPERAEDLVQDFFVHLMEHGGLLKADPERGRFRTFLRACLRNFLADEREKGHALKRGGGIAALSLDFSEAERRYGKQMGQAPSPEQAFERQFAVDLVERTLGGLRAEFDSAGKLALYEDFKEYLTGNYSRASYREKAESLGMSDVAVRVAVHRLRKRFGEMLKQEVADTVLNPDEIEDEIRHLISVLG